MRRGVLAAAGLALLAAVSWSAAPAQAMAISAPAALKGASDSISPAETVHCWDCGYYGGPVYYGGYRPYYRPYWGGGYGYGYYAPRPRFYFGPRVYWY